MNAVTHLVLTLVQSPWVFVVLAALLIVDGFFPLVPGETTVVALATLGASGHGPAPLAVLFVAIGATMVGDGIAFWIGRKVGPSRWAWMRRPKPARALLWAANHIEGRPGLILVVAKFLPFARVAVTMTAGASALPVRRYLLLSLVAASLYTVYHVTVATTAGTLLSAHPLIALASSVGFGLVSAALIAGLRRVMRRRKASST
ncbi:MAG: DedA family protein [Microbacteriaceae bacterium]|nr:DedA family protein [Microbacteriaceae bacterium]